MFFNPDFKRCSRH